MITCFTCRETEASWDSKIPRGYAKEGKADCCSGPRYRPVWLPGTLAGSGRAVSDQDWFPVCKPAWSLCASRQAAAFEQLVLIMWGAH